MQYLITASTYHRFISPTQTPQDLEKQIQTREIWGKAAQNFYQSDIPKVKAFVGKLPEAKQGIEFTTNIPPDPHTPPYLATWSGNRPGVRTEDGYAKLKVITIDAYLL